MTWSCATAILRSSNISTKTHDRIQVIASAPIGPLMLRLTIPMIFGIVSLMLLGVADMYFIGLLGTEPLAAAGFALPITGMVSAVALGIGMAQSSITSRLVGEGRLHDGAQFVTHAQLFGVAVALFLLVAGQVSIHPLFSALGADTATLPLIQEYMGTWYYAAPLLFITLLGTNALRAIGDTRKSAIVSAQLALLNLALDPLLIFGLGPIPAFGIQGAAIATIIAAGITAITAVLILARQEKLLEISWPKMAELRRNWRQLLSIAIPAVAANMMTPLAATVITAMIAGFGTAAVAGFGVGTRLEAIALVIVYALSSTLPMFIGQNIGAGKPDRAYRALMGCLKFALLLHLGVYLILVLAGPWLAGQFSDDPAVQQVILTFLWILPASYGAHGIVILVMVALNVLGRPRTALAITIIRLAILYVPLAYLGATVGGLQGLFMGAALGNVLAAIWTAVIIRRVCRDQRLAAPLGALA
jgi:putative MATE family efflux protein